MKIKVLTNNPTSPKSRYGPPVLSSNVAIMLTKNQTMPIAKLIFDVTNQSLAFICVILSEKKDIIFVRTLGYFWLILLMKMFRD